MYLTKSGYNFTAATARRIIATPLNVFVIVILSSPVHSAALMRNIPESL